MLTAQEPADFLAILFTEFRLPGRVVYPRLWTRPLKGLWPLLPSLHIAVAK